jgi:hypothetical protein
LIEPLDAKTGILDQFVDRTVQVTATGQTLPGWGEMILPPAHSRLAPMLNKEKATARSQYPTHLLERGLDFGDAAHCPCCRHDSIYIVVLNGKQRSMLSPFPRRAVRCDFAFAALARSLE